MALCYEGQQRSKTMTNENETTIQEAAAQTLAAIEAYLAQFK